MKINIIPHTGIIKQLSQDPEITKPQHVALIGLQTVVENAQSSAYSYPPQPVFTYTEVFASSLVEALSPKQVNELKTVNIEFLKPPGMKDHKVKLTFQS